VPVPQLPKDTLDQPDVAYATYWVNGVWARGGSKAAAWDFLKFAASKDSLQRIYAAASQVRLFGEPYPISDMVSLTAADPIAGAFAAQGPNSQSWFLASRTFDGATGINSQISSYFEDGVSGIHNKQSASRVLGTVASGVTQVLRQYGISATSR